MNPQNWFAIRSGVIIAWLAVLVCCGVAALGWFGYRAAREWLRSSEKLIERRETEISGVLRANLTLDMRAIQSTILTARDWNADALESRETTAEKLAPIFSRYLYPEAFFAWYVDSPTVFFARSNRIPSWFPASNDKAPYPVRMAEDSQIAGLLRTRLEADIAAGREYSIFETQVNGLRYQVVALPLHRRSSHKQPDAAFGFMVNLDWVRGNYLGPMAEQFVKNSDTVGYTIVDDQGTPISGHPLFPPELHARTSRLQLFFFDQAIVNRNPPADLPKWWWTIQVSASRDPTLTIAARGAQRTMLVVAAGALALGIGLLIMVRAARTAAEVAAMQSDFVSAVTHELKTPMAVIHGIGETMRRGRVSTSEQQHEYAQLLVQETNRLRRLVDNLLAYSRVTEVSDVYSYHPLRPVHVVDETVRGFQSLIQQNGFRLNVNVPASLPPINADRTAIVLALGNLIDNAMRYSGESRDIAVRAQELGRKVEFVIVDHGKGIPADDLRRVQQRFARGRSSNGHGSGLGLAIVSRIAKDHGGRFHLFSEVDVGTTATLAIPLAPA